MKKRVLSTISIIAITIAFLASALVPASAGHMSGFYVCDMQIEDGQTYTKNTVGFSDIITNNGSIKREGDKLILNNVTINSDGSDGIAVYFYDEDSIGSDVTIELIGQNYINISSEVALDSQPDGLYWSGHVEEEGIDPQLTIQSVASSKGSLTINEGRIRSPYFKMLINNCNLSINNTIPNYGITASGDLSITNSTVNVTGKSDGIFVDGADLSVSGSTLSATGERDGIIVRDYEEVGGHINISNSTVTGTATDYTDSENVGIFSYGHGITTRKSVVNAVGFNALLAIDGDIDIQGGKVTASANEESGIAIAAAKTSAEATDGNITLGSNMFIKVGGRIVNNVSVYSRTISTIGEGNVTDLSGVARQVVICEKGTVSVQTQKPASISSITLPSTDEIKNIVLTEADRAAMEIGDNVNVQLVVNSVNTPSDSDKVQQSLGTNELGMYLDISLLKTVGETQTTIHQLSAPIRITFTIPENLRGKDKYYVIRVHDGSATVLNDLDSDPNTVTFETDRFSTYALVYSESANTGDKSNIIATAVIAISSLFGVAYIEKKKAK